MLPKVQKAPKHSCTRKPPRRARTPRQGMAWAPLTGPIIPELHTVLQSANRMKSQFGVLHNLCPLESAVYQYYGRHLLELIHCIMCVKPCVQSGTTQSYFSTEYLVGNNSQCRFGVCCYKQGKAFTIEQLFINQCYKLTELFTAGPKQCNVQNFKCTTSLAKKKLCLQNFKVKQLLSL